MALEAATIEGPVTALEQKPAEITPETTAKQLAAAVKERGEDFGVLDRNAAWLRAGPFSGRIIQALFCLPFKAEEVSDDPVETMARIYVKARRHWPVYTQGCVVWLLELMRQWWGGLPTGGESQATPRQQPRSDGEADSDEDWDLPEQVDISFSTTGTTAHVPVSSDYTACVEFTDEDKDDLRDIRRRYGSGELTKSEAVARVVTLLDERTRDCYFNGNADDGDDHWDEDYAEIDRDDESIDHIESREAAVSIVDAWD